MSQRSESGRRKPVVEVEFVATETYNMIGEKSGQAAHSPSEPSPAMDNLNSVLGESENPLLDKGEQAEQAAKQEAGALVGLLLGVALVVGGYCAWKWFKTPPLTK